MKQYDAVIIGSGTAGQTAAHDLAAAGCSVALVERSDTPGGVCALRGCQAKKWFYEVTEVVARGHHLHNIGITVPPQANWREILKEKNRFTTAIPESTVDSLRGDTIDYLAGTAQFRDDETLQVEGEPVMARFYVLATGARPTELPFAGHEHLATSSDFLELTELPPRIAFIGGGFISFEFAHFAARLGGKKGEIHILEATSRPLAEFDNDMVDQLVLASREEGIVIHTDVSVGGVHKHGPYYRVELESGISLEVDLVVNGAGRAPDIDSLNLEAAGVRYTEEGITTDASMRTSNPAIFAVGDCAASLQLARVGDREAQVAAAAIIAERQGGKAPQIDYGCVPAVLFTYPQLGSVGKTEEQLRREGAEFRKSYGTGLNWPTYRRVGMKHAAFKILADEEGRIAGAHFLADNTTGLLNTFKQAMIDRTPVAKLHADNVMSPYPSRESDIIYMLRSLLD